MNDQFSSRNLYRIREDASIFRITKCCSGFNTLNTKSREYNQAAWVFTGIKVSDERCADLMSRAAA